MRGVPDIGRARERISRARERRCERARAGPQSASGGPQSTGASTLGSAGGESKPESAGDLAT